MSETKTRSIRLPYDFDVQLTDWLLRHDMSFSDACRLALQQLLEAPAVSGASEIHERLAYVSIILHQPPNQKSWEWLRKEMENLCMMTEKISESYDGLTTEKQALKG